MRENLLKTNIGIIIKAIITIETIDMGIKLQIATIETIDMGIIIKAIITIETIDMGIIIKAIITIETIDMGIKLQKNPIKFFL
jgi:hypothetical protein